MHFVQAEKLYYETALLGKLEQGLGAVLSQRSAGFGAAPHEGLGQHPMRVWGSMRVQYYGCVSQHQILYYHQNIMAVKIGLMMIVGYYSHMTYTLGDQGPITQTHS